jgi:hypothetical protein
VRVAPNRIQWLPHCKAVMNAGLAKNAGNPWIFGQLSALRGIPSAMKSGLDKRRLVIYVSRWTCCAIRVPGPQTIAYRQMAVTAEAWSISAVPDMHTVILCPLSGAGSYANNNINVCWPVKCVCWGWGHSHRPCLSGGRTLRVSVCVPDSHIL